MTEPDEPTISGDLWPGGAYMSTMCYCGDNQTIRPDGTFRLHTNRKTGEPCPTPEQTEKDRARYDAFKERMADLLRLPQEG